MKQLTLFGEEKQKDELEGYNPQRQKIIKEHLEKVEKHNKRCEENKCPECNRELKIWYALGGKKILGCSSISCNYEGVEI